jgi:hypothetical protein
MRANLLIVDMSATSRPRNINGQRTRWLSLIRSVIRLRPAWFGAHHAGHMSEFTGVPDMCRIQARRLGKRVGDGSCS